MLAGAVLAACLLVAAADSPRAGSSDPVERPGLKTGASWNALPGASVQSPRRESGVVRGSIVDAGTGAPVADVRVALVEPNQSVRTAADGRFEFRGLTAGTYTLTVSRIGYIFVHREIEVGADGVLDLVVPIAEGTGTYRETVTVTADATPARATGVASEASLGSAALQDLRVVAADDPLRAMHALPGVATGDDFKAQFSVRASSFRHVGFVLDGTATPLLLHAIRGIEDSGSIAMINTDVLTRATLAAGSHPRRHGDWIGATMEFETRDGSRDRAGGRLAISATSASTVVEGPLGRDRRGSWLLSLRTSYLDWLVRKIEPDLDEALGFTDAHAKVVYDVNDRQQVQFLFVGGDAGFEQTEATGLNQLALANSQSALFSGAWRYVRARGMFSQRISLVRNSYDDRARLGHDLGRGRAHSAMWRGDASWTLSGAWSIEGGLKYESQHAQDVRRLFRNNDGRLAVRAERRIDESTRQSSVWTQIVRSGDASGFAAGVRVTHDSLDGRTMTSPWVLAERRLGPVTLRAASSTAAQMPELELRRALPGQSLRPECATFADLGLDYRLTPTMRWQITGFVRDEWHVIRRVGEDRLVDGEIVREDPFLARASSLHGTARGFDVLFERRAASGLTGWVGYTYSKLRHHDTVTGERFDADFDQRHTFNAFVQQRLSYRTTIGAKLRIGSNVPLVGYFDGDIDALRLGAERNGVRLPTYARLDLRVTRTFTFARRRVTLFVELMNALDRENIAQSNGSIRPTLQASGFLQKLIPRVPSAGMLIEF